MTTTRDPSEAELAVLVKLLGPSFPGVAELRKQLDGVAVAQADEADPLTLLLFPVSGSPRAVARRRIPVEGIASDVDGTSIHYLLHVQGAHLAELEVYREDGDPVLLPPKPEQIEVVLY